MTNYSKIYCIWLDIIIITIIKCNRKNRIPTTKRYKIKETDSRSIETSISNPRCCTKRPDHCFYGDASIAILRNDGWSSGASVMLLSDSLLQWQTQAYDSNESNKILKKKSSKAVIHHAGVSSPRRQEWKRREKWKGHDVLLGNG